MSDLSRYRSVLGAGHILGLMLILVPMVELAVYALPITPSAIRWRYGAIGYMGQGLALPAVGLVMSLMTAALLKQRRMLRVLSVLCLLGALFMALAFATLLLDGVQLRSAVEGQLRQTYDAASLKALMNIGFMFLLTTWMGVTASRASRAGGGRRSESSGPVIATGTGGEAEAP